MKLLKVKANTVMGLSKEWRGGAQVWLQLLHWLSAQQWGGAEGEREKERERVGG